MTITNGYATLPEFKAWISETETVLDSMLEERVEAASRWIDARCGRHFYQVTETRLYDTADPRLACIDDLVSVTTLKTDGDGDGVYETTWSPSDYQLLPPAPAFPAGRPYNQLLAVAGKQFPRRPTSRTRVGRIEVTGVWGWPAIPDGVHTACLIQASRGLKRRHSPEGVVGFGEFGAVRVGFKDDPDVEAYLREFMPVLVA